MSNKIALLFRHSIKNRFSIESLFVPLVEQENIEKYEIPCLLTSLFSLIKIFLFTFKIKEKLVHVTGDIQYVVLFIPFKKTIITVHDLYHLEQLKGFRKQVYSLFWFYIPFKLANRVVAISPNTYNQIISAFPSVKEKTIIIPNTFNKINKIKNVNKNNEFFTILAIGSTKNKNIERLIDSILGLSNIKLIIVGELQQEMIKKIKSSNICFEKYSNLKKEELDKIYNSTDLLFFASIQEGFGIPILEAQSIGLPVITSNISSMPYVAGKGAVYVSPFSVDEIRQQILKIKNNNEVRNEIISNGFDNIKRFSNELFIKSYQNLYKEL